MRTWQAYRSQVGGRDLRCAAQRAPIHRALCGWATARDCAPCSGRYILQLRHRSLLIHAFYAAGTPCYAHHVKRARASGHCPETCASIPAQAEKRLSWDWTTTPPLKLTGNICKMRRFGYQVTGQVLPARQADRLKPAVCRREPRGHMARWVGWMADWLAGRQTDFICASLDTSLAHPRIQLIGLNALTSMHPVLDAIIVVANSPPAPT